MFNDRYGLTQAVLSDRITMTRRIVSPQPTLNEYSGISWKGYSYGINDYPPTDSGSYYNFTKTLGYNRNYKGYKVGEVVAVAQNYHTVMDNISKNESKERAEYYCKIMRTCYPNEEYPLEYEDIAGWNNKMFVRADLMPHQIKITNVSLQRLQDISDEDCLREGIYEHIILGSNRKVYAYNAIPPDYLATEWFDTPRKAFATLIDKISGKGTWEKDPFVFVYEFELIK